MKTGNTTARSSVGPIRTQSGGARIRVTRACDLCHRKGNKCAPSHHDGVCERCFAAGSECTYDRPVRRRGPAPGFKVTPRSPPEHTPDSTWEADLIAEPEVIEALVSIYHDIVYPIFCFFHWPTFLERVRKRQYRHNRAFFATVMTVCSIVSGRLRDGASLSQVKVPSAYPQPDEFYRVAEDAIPIRLEEASLFEYVRATALLAITSIQQGEITRMQQHLSNYATLATTIGLYEEKRWASDLTRAQVEERKRLFWSIYTLDVYASCVWGSLTRWREIQTLVSYPVEVDDEYIPSTIDGACQQPANKLSWLRGWNFVTDMYRVLEHAIDHSRLSRADKKLDARYSSIYIRSPEPQEIINFIEQSHAELPERFRRVERACHNPVEDRLSFQSANIRVTLQLVEVVVLGSDSFSVEARCRIGAKFLDDVRNLPLEYLQATSAPLHYHLAAIGHFLGAIVKTPFLRESFLQVRSVLLSLADYLSEVEGGLHFGTGVSERLRREVANIDSHISRHKPVTQNHQSGRGSQEPVPTRPAAIEDVKQPVDEPPPHPPGLGAVGYPVALGAHEFAHHPPPPPPPVHAYQPMEDTLPQHPMHAQVHLPPGPLPTLDPSSGHILADATPPFPSPHAHAPGPAHHQHPSPPISQPHPQHPPPPELQGWHYQLPAELLSELRESVVFGHGPMYPDFFGFEPWGGT